MLKFRTIFRKPSVDVIALARKTFYQQEPINRAINLTKNEDDCQELDEYFQFLLKTGMYVRAEDENLNLVGFLTTEFIPSVKNFQFKSEKLKKIFNLLDDLEKKAEVRSRFPEHGNILEFKVGTIDQKYQSKHLAQIFIDVARLWAISNDIDLIVVPLTNTILIPFMKKLNFVQLANIKYADYIKNGKTVFELEPPYIESSLLVYDCKSHRQTKGDNCTTLKI